MEMETESSFDEFEKKVNEIILELQSRRNLQNEHETKLLNIHQENLNLHRTIKAMITDSDKCLLQLEGAVNALRQSKKDETDIREMNAHQKLLLQSTLVDRECILERNKNLEIENKKLQRSLANAQEMLMDPNALSKKKELLYKKSFTLLSGQLNEVDKTHEKLSEMLGSVKLVIEKATFHLDEQCKFVEQLKSDKTSLEAQVLNLLVEIERMEISSSNDNPSLCQELRTVQFDVKGKLKSKDEEIEQLQKSLQVAFDAIKASQSVYKEMEQAIEWSRPMLIHLKNSLDYIEFDLVFSHTTLQTDENKQESNSLEQ